MSLCRHYHHPCFAKEENNCRHPEQPNQVHYLVSDRKGIGLPIGKLKSRLFFHWALWTCESFFFFFFIFILHRSKYYPNNYCFVFLPHSLLSLKIIHIFMLLQVCSHTHLSLTSWKMVFRNQLDFPDLSFMLGLPHLNFYFIIYCDF